MSVIADIILKVATNGFVFAIFVIWCLVRLVFGRRIAKAVGMYISLLVVAGCFNMFGMMFPTSTQVVVLVILILAVVLLGQPVPRKKKGK